MVTVELMRSVNTVKLARISVSQQTQEQTRILMPRTWQLLPKLDVPYHRSLTPEGHVRCKAFSTNERLKVPHSFFCIRRMPGPNLEIDYPDIPRGFTQPLLPSPFHFIVQQSSTIRRYTVCDNNNVLTCAKNLN